MRKEKTLIGLTTLLIVLFAFNGVALSQQTPLEAPSPLAAGATFLEQEAGIAAYTKVYAVDLIKAQLAFKNVEKKTDSYIIGSISLSGYPETDDVHVYVDVTGWIAAYYLAKEPASKIIDWLDYSGGAITSTKLEDALVKVTNVLAVEMPYTNYYDFRYPEATKIMIVTDEKTGSGTESFKMLIPSNYVVYSRTWSLAIHSYSRDWCNHDGNIKIDGTTLKSGSACNYWGIWQGTITPTQLSPEIYHTISVYNKVGKCANSHIGIVLLYKE